MTRTAQLGRVDTRRNPFFLECNEEINDLNSSEEIVDFFTYVGNLLKMVANDTGDGRYVVVGADIESPLYQRFRELRQSYESSGKLLAAIHVCNTIVRIFSY